MLKMNVQLTVDHNNLIKDIALKEEFSNFNLETESGSLKGDGYLGIITTVNIINGKKKLNLILKSAQTNEELRKRAPIRAAYLREIYIYETIFPEFDKFQRENGLANGFSGVAKIYGSCDKENNECLVLENLREIGYKLWNRKLPMNSDHVALVFAEYGKFHAISLAMNSKKPTEYKRLTESLGDIFRNGESMEGLPKIQQLIIESGYKAVKGNIFATEAMKRFEASLEAFFTVNLQTPEDQIVVVHGDCWCNNMMFKYEDGGDTLKPTKVCLIDWQIARIGSPALDLSYFFFVCSSKEILHDSERYLKIYHDNLSESLRKFSCDVETVFPFTLLEYHWKRYSKFALFMALMIMKLMFSEEDEIPDLAKSAESGNILSNIASDIAQTNQFNQRIVDIVTVMAENNII